MFLNIFYQHFYESEGNPKKLFDAVGPPMSRQSVLRGSPPPPDYRVPRPIRAAAIEVIIWLF